jgi:hypothetical protein
VSADRPINADVEGKQDPPEPVDKPKDTEEQPKGAPRDEPTPKPVEPRRRRRGIPGPIKLVAALVLIAVAFIVLAIVAGGGSKKGDESAAPSVTTTTVTSSEPEQTSSEDESGSEEGNTDELGYPSFATSNTTRIGGPDPASNAAAAALAVFPGTNEKQRPIAVALVDTEDWAGAIAAAVLMAEPIRAPLLFGEAEGVPDPTAEALDTLQPHGGAASGGAVLAIGDVQVPKGMSAAKVAAGDAATEAAAIARLRDRIAGTKPDAIILASSSEPAFAAPAAAYAARSGDPVLFTDAKELPRETIAALRRDEGLPVYALGPGSAISGKVLKEVEGVGGAKVQRISGDNPVAAAIAFARFDDGKFGWHVTDPGHGFVLVRSDSPQEAAAAAPLSASGTWGPLLLTDSADTLPSELRGYFLDVKPGYTTDPTRAFYNHVWIVGDAGQISVEQQAEVNEVAELAKIGSEE